MPCSGPQTKASSQDPLAPGWGCPFPPVRALPRAADPCFAPSRGIDMRPRCAAGSRGGALGIGKGRGWGKIRPQAQPPAVPPGAAIGAGQAAGGATRRAAAFVLAPSPYHGGEAEA
ncbi:hypothetical protein SVIO_069190 [Streptomyces violaceusniger]|uniref:Uncharacterized protein n=1 Tax=Streptomyces violaceusniger TaxID=68280 RepID=A0A4D4LAR9_STRVO|nr:hypothetical protein SVIO_069190 [Streptomyces violaceusniger]